MKNENPDTLPDTEQTRWMETHAEDVFLPSVRVQLNWRDVEFAVEQGAIVATQAHVLWANWAMPGNSTRLGTEDDDIPEPDTGPVLESSWARQPMPLTRPLHAKRRLKGGWWFVFGLLAGAALVWVYASVRGISLLG